MRNEQSMSEMIPIRHVQPRHRCIWLGYELEVERQARRTTFARVVSGPLEGARLQLKHSKEVQIAKQPMEGLSR
jgi:hypothetical protein